MCYGGLDPKYQMREIEARASHAGLAARRGLRKPLLDVSKTGWRPWSVFGGAFVASLLALTGCDDSMLVLMDPATAQPAVFARPEHFSPQVRKDMSDYFFASWVARNCGGVIPGPLDYQGDLAPRALAEARSRGVYLGSPIKLTQFMSIGDANAAQYAFIEKHKINQNSRLDWCKAKRAEAAQKTGIGRYLD
jgi:hypothetical protein